MKHRKVTAQKEKPSSTVTSRTSNGEYNDDHQQFDSNQIEDSRNNEVSALTFPPLCFYNDKEEHVTTLELGSSFISPEASEMGYTHACNDKDEEEHVTTLELGSSFISPENNEEHVTTLELGTSFISPEASEMGFAHYKDNDTEDAYQYHGTQNNENGYFNVASPRLRQPESCLQSTTGQ